MSSNAFDETPTAGDVLAGVDLHGKRMFVTGVSSGPGIETARSLSLRDVQVVGAVRDPALANVEGDGLAWSSSTWRRLPACARARIRLSPTAAPSIS